MSIMATHRRSLGVNFSSRGESEILVWAPHAKEVTVVIVDSGERILLRREARGYHGGITPALKPAMRYWFELDGEQLADPASLLQPEGVFGPSEVFNPHAFHWTDQQWKNSSLKEYIIYELHVGTFTESGDFAGIIAKLPHLKALGVTAIELMPVAEFPGSRNWGYDGVFAYAAHHAYGGPRDLQELVNACHEHGIAVVLDVVYNHVGPEGNVLPKFGDYFTDKYRTPWGQAINFDDAGSDEVRKYYLENALMWMRDFHIDALRLDAVHAIRDFGATHFLAELRDHVDALSSQMNRPFYLIAECDLNDPKFISNRDQQGYGMHAQWIDEFHHALRVASGKKPEGYYSDFGEFIYLGKAFKDAYVYDGQYSEHRQKTFGKKASGLSGESFVVFSQNHDQVGNSMRGDRTSVQVDFELLKVMAAAVICSPYLPLLFMGEEYAEERPFQYFVSHAGEELVEAVRNGRKKEFAAFFNDEGEVPDPQSEQTYLNSKLDWTCLEDARHAAMFRYYRRLIAVRKHSRILASCDRERLHLSVQNSEKCLVVHRWKDNDHIVCVFNFSDEAHSLEMPALEHLRGVVNSADKEWRGSGEATPAYDKHVRVAPKCFLLFSSEHV